VNVSRKGVDGAFTNQLK